MSVSFTAPSPGLGPCLMPRNYLLKEEVLPVPQSCEDRCRVGINLDVFWPPLISQPPLRLAAPALCH